MSEAMTYKLPPLPEPTALGMDFDKGWDGIRAYGYTEDDMQAYAIAAIEAQGVPDGWQLVPKEPTQEMLIAGTYKIAVGASYKAMLASAPPAPQAAPKNRPSADWYKAKIMETLDDDFHIGPAPKASEAQQEPVAFCALNGFGNIAFFDGKPMLMPGRCGNEHHPVPLYTHPAQQAKPQPLSREQVKGLCESAGYNIASPTQQEADFINGIRYAEAAHEITKE